MIVDGKALAAKVKEKLKKKAHGKNLCLAVVWVGDNEVSAKYVARKKKLGEEVGVEVRVYEYAAEISQAELEEEIKKLADKSEIKGIIVQLPLPAHLEEEKILNLIPAEKDVDALSQEARVYSPVVEAVREILEEGGVEIEGKRAAVLGRGKLVGKPVALWLSQEGAEVEIIHSQTSEEEKKRILKTVDIIVSGVGEPGLIKPEDIKEGVVLIDAATSESNGKLVGDADPSCADKCALFTPVPGGVGPLTVVMLFKNLIDLND